jgi:uncharacterized protein (DUF2141 family)
MNGKIVWFMVLFGCVSAAAPSGLAQPAGACATMDPAIEVHVTGFKDRKGQVRAELFSDQKEDFLGSKQTLLGAGRVFNRLDMPTPSSGDAIICMPVPRPGSYSMVLLHDRNLSGEFNAFTDGFGFPNNPRLGFSKPAVERATVTVGETVLKIEVVLNYVQGLSVKPWKKPAP